MELKDLKYLVRNGENAKVEFKLKTNHPEKIVREIAAFANTNGGHLMIGVSDDKQLVGLKFPDEDEYLIIKSMEKHLIGSINYTLDKIKLENEKEVLIFTIEPSNHKPIYYKSIENPEDKKVYVRSADQSLQASKEVKEILKGRSKDKNYKFQYGEKENLLIKYLDKNNHITVSQFVDLAKISLKIASRTLVLLVLAGLLDVIPQELEDHFVLCDKI